MKQEWNCKRCKIAAALLRLISRRPRWKREQMKQIQGIMPEFVSGNIFIRPIHLQMVGQQIKGHTHNFDHTTIILTGSVNILVERPDKTTYEQSVAAPNFLLIRAQYKHEITALEENTTLFCVYSHRTPQGTITLEATGWEKAYY
jgi:hypothetical protein